nr:unnamed protein product [Haemonchus contortus]
MAAFIVRRRAGVPRGSARREEGGRRSVSLSKSYGRDHVFHQAVVRHVKRKAVINHYSKICTTTQRGLYWSRL